jgi:DNA replication protein DnaC
MCADSSDEAPASRAPAAIGDAKVLREWPAEPPDWLVPDDAAACRRCRDTGVVVRAFATAADYCRHFGLAEEDMTRRERSWFARVEASGRPATFAAPCACASRRERERRFARAVEGLSRALAEARLEGVHRDVPYKAAALKRARAFVRRLAGGAGGVLVFAGETGTGKTYVAVASLRAAVDAGLRGAFVTSAEFCDDLRERCYSVADVRAYIRELRGHDLVVLDDFGSERVGPAEGAVLDHYARFLKSFEAGGGLIVTTNLDLQRALTARFGDEGDRIARRLGEAQFGPTLRFGAGVKGER